MLIYFRILVVLAVFIPTSSFAATLPSLPQGRYLKIGENTIYVVSSGKGKNIIFESGLGSSIETWEKVAPSIAEHAHVILYDRAGIGKSSVNTHDQKMRTAQDAVNNLLSVLKQLHIKPPYIVVGHSLGGLYLQLFAREFPKMIAGMILVDSVSPNQKIHDVLPNKSASYYPEALGVKISEKEVLDAKPFPNIPLIVLSATIHGPINSNANLTSNKKQWAQLQEELSTMSTDSQHVTANNTDHSIQSKKPWLVVAAINEVIKRTSR